MKLRRACVLFLISLTTFLAGAAAWGHLLREAPENISAAKSCSPPLLIGHRGSRSLAPENTLPAFQNAIALGGDGVEIDVSITKDGKLVAFHDKLLSRTTNDTQGRNLSDTDFKELRSLDAGAWFGEEFTGTRVPLLEEIFEALGSKVVYLFDVREEAVVKPLTEFIKAQVFENTVIISSFYRRVLKRASKHKTNNVKLLYWLTKMKNLRGLKELGVTYVRVPRKHQHRAELNKSIRDAGFLSVISSSYLSYDVSIAIVNNMQKGLKRKKRAKPAECRTEKKRLSSHSSSGLFSSSR